MREKHLEAISEIFSVVWKELFLLSSIFFFLPFSVYEFSLMNMGYFCNSENRDGSIRDCPGYKGIHSGMSS